MSPRNWWVWVTGWSFLFSYISDLERKITEIFSMNEELMFTVGQKLSMFPPDKLSLSFYVHAVTTK